MTLCRQSISKAANLREPEIKAALIDALFAEHMIYDDTIIVSEMPVVAMSRRADVVVANGHLVGFEIKSDGDKTSRLTGQLEAYQKAFEGIVIVTGAKHLQECLVSSAASVGVVAVDQLEDGHPIARIVRKPHLRKLGLDEAIKQMRADELYALSRRTGIFPGARDRFTLESQIRTLPASVVRSAALDAIKARYRAPYEAFIAARKTARSTISALEYLRRPIARHRRMIANEPLASDFVNDLATLKTLSLSVRPRRPI